MVILHDQTTIQIGFSAVVALIVVEGHRFGDALTHHSSQGQMVGPLLLICRHVGQLLIKARLYRYIYEEVPVLHLIDSFKAIKLLLGRALII